MAIKRSRKPAVSAKKQRETEDHYWCHGGPYDGIALWLPKARGESTVPLRWPALGGEYLLQDGTDYYWKADI